MKELRRSSTNRVLFGVCGGLGDYFDINPTILRFLFVVFAFMGFSGVVLYILLALIMPGDQTIGETFKEGKWKEYAKNVWEEQPSTSTSSSLPQMSDNNRALGIIIILGGIYILLSYYNLLSYVNFNIVLPVFLIILGILVFAKRKVSLVFLVILFLVLCFLSALTAFLPIRYY